MEFDVGPCLGRFRKFYYDFYLRKCREVTFGGCGGNGNRFSSLQECEGVCVVVDETSLR